MRHLLTINYLGTCPPKLIINKNTTELILLIHEVWEKKTRMLNITDIASLFDTRVHQIHDCRTGKIEKNQDLKRSIEETIGLEM